MTCCGMVGILTVLLAACAGDEPQDQARTGATAAASDSPAPEPAPSPDADTRSTGPPPSADVAARTSRAPATQAPSAGSVTIGATGDLLAHESVIDSAAAYARSSPQVDYDFSPMFAEVADLLREPEVSLCHLETPLSPDNTELSRTGVFTFNAPHELAEAVAGAGWDGCEFASNHTMDHGLQGLTDTEAIIREAGLGYTGPTTHQERAGKPQTYDVRGTRVAHLAYTYTYPNDGSPTTVVPSQAPWLRRNLWPALGSEGISADAATARAAGADFVVVSMHWGQEYQTEPTEQQRMIARQLLGSGDVDLILGTQVHVVQPCEKINDRYVFYGLGNFLSNQSPQTTGGVLRTETQEGVIVSVTLSRTVEGALRASAAYRPTRVDLEGHVVRLVSPGSDTYQRTVTTMASLGAGACDAEPMP